MSGTQEYVVITDVTGQVGGTVQRGEVDVRAAATAEEKLEGKVVEVADLTPREARALDNSPGKVTALNMPISVFPSMVKLNDGSWTAADNHEQPDLASGASWGVHAVGADQSGFTGSDVSVAVLDTGIDATHAAFAGITSIVESDFTGEGNGDGHGHGTHCAGTIFGRDVEGYRIGIARGVDRVLIGKVLDSRGRGGSAALFDGLYWALKNQADVISMSLGFDFPGMVLQNHRQLGLPIDLATSQALVAYRQNLRALDALMALAKVQSGLGAGPVILAATGNESKADSVPKYRIDANLPSAAQDVLGVAAAQLDDGAYRIAGFSNSSPVISAPGVDIISARRGGGLVSMSGTSMACPHAAGVAALWWESIRQGRGSATAFSVAARLSVTARTNVFKAGFTNAEFGDGLVTAPN